MRSNAKYSMFWLSQLTLIMLSYPAFALAQEIFGLKAIQYDEADFKTTQPNFGMEFRLDLVKETTNETKAIEESVEEAQNILKLDSRLILKIITARLTLDGLVDSRTKYKVRLDFTASRENENQIDNTSDTIELWYVQRKVLYFLPAVRAGKIEVLAGAIETQMYNQADLYHTSRSYQKFKHHEVGGDVNFEVWDQLLTIQMVNSPLHLDNQNGASVNAGWRGDFLAGAIQTIAAWGRFPSAETVTETVGSGTTKTVKDGFAQRHASAGMRANIKVFETHNIRLEAESAFWKQPRFSTTISIRGIEPTLNISKLYTLQSTIGGFRYETPFLHYLLRGSLDVEKQEGIPEQYDEIAETATQLSTGVEYYPEGRINTYRVHLIYIKNIATAKDEQNIISNFVNFGVSVGF